MKLAVVVEFYDMKADVLRKVGETLTEEDARGRELMAARVCAELPEEPEAEKPAVKKPARKTAKK